MIQVIQHPYLRSLMSPVPCHGCQGIDEIGAALRRRVCKAVLLLQADALFGDLVMPETELHGLDVSNFEVARSLKMLDRHHVSRPCRRPCIRWRRGSGGSCASAVRRAQHAITGPGRMLLRGWRQDMAGGLKLADRVSSPVT